MIIDYDLRKNIVIEYFVMASLDVVTAEGRPITRLSNLLSKSPQYRSSSSPETKLVSRQADFDFQRAITIDVKNESKVIRPEKKFLSSSNIFGQKEPSA